MPTRISILGKRFGRLRVMSETDSDGNLRGTPKNRKCVAECECGSVREYSSRSIRRGHTLSCGCLQKDAATRHGLDSHPLMQIYRSMLSRCRVSPTYAGRGISVCLEWAKSPEKFIGWSEKNGWVPGLHIDRKNNDDDYCPGNCRFVTPKDNQNNRRNNRIIEIFGKKMTVAQASESYSINYNKLYQRIFRLGWTAEKAVQK